MEKLVTLQLPEKTYRSVTCRIVSAQKIQDFNSFEKPEVSKPVAFKDAPIKNNLLNVNLPPHAVVVLEMK